MRTALQFQFELFEHGSVRLSPDLDLATRQIARVTFYTKSLCGAQCKPSVADALNAAPNEVMFRANHNLKTLR